MASNVHTMEGIPPETTGPREGPRLSPAQARALRVAHGARIYKIESVRMIGSRPASYEHVYVAVKDTAAAHVIAPETGDALIELGLWVRFLHLYGQETYRSTNAAAAALRAGNIG